MLPRMPRASGLVLALLLTACGGAQVASAPPVLVLPAADAQPSLGLEAVVQQPFEYERDGERYVGGVTWVMVHAPVAEVRAVVGSVDTLAQVLPRTRRATLLTQRGTDRYVELVQGTDLVSATYTVRLRESPDGFTTELALDRSRPHGVRDVWGYFRTVDLGPRRTLLNVVAAVDIGPGIARWLFESRIQKLILTTPLAWRDYVESHSPAAEPDRGDDRVALRLGPSVR
jgi:hypothetical protein